MFDQLWNMIVLGAAVGMAWLAGEMGRAVVIGGFGGLARWFGEEQRTIKTALGAWSGGAICGVYLTPLVMWIVGYPVSSFDSQDQRVFAAFVFVTGAVGIGLLKIVIAGIQTKAKKWSASDD